MKTTKEDFLLFKKYALEWQERLGVTEWALYFEHTKDNMTDVYAQVFWDNGARLATIRFNKDWDGLREKSPKEIERAALHEVLHVLFADFCAAGEARYSTQAYLDSSEHAVIRRLEKVFIDA